MAPPEYAAFITLRVDLKGASFVRNSLRVETGMVLSSAVQKGILNNDFLAASAVANKSRLAMDDL
jgi:hypothetical protein